MASAAPALRRCLLTFSRRAPICRNPPPRTAVARRTFSTTPMRWRPARRDDDELEEEEDDDEVDVEGAAPEASPEQIAEMRQLVRDEKFQEKAREWEHMVEELDQVRKNMFAIPPVSVIKNSFYSADEPDPEYIGDEANDPQLEEEDITSMAHGKLEEFREYREYARIAAWQMPLLSKLARPFEPPSMEEPLRFRYTTYMGESHPAERKVVVEFSPRDMPLDEAQQMKLRKLLGPRWNPETDVAKMSCEQFEHQAQNKRYLADLVQKLVAEAQDRSDMFEDVPLDTRHHTFKVLHKFPKEWRLTPERRAFLDDARQQALLLDQKKAAEGTLVNGPLRIEEHFRDRQTRTAREPAQKRVPEYARNRSDRLAPPKPNARASRRAATPQFRF
ncbi:hypothetical protein GGR56DRAFT_651100 [Xylariaceae sp. FL0804]|nr:hypothetical protein GGR56DRAFT_651100 [Xylariaceae sp. FL0804]